MAKEFKAFDKKYAKLAGGALNFIRKLNGSIAREDIEECTHWPEELMGKFVDYYPIPIIRFAVYDSPDAPEWQKFRVGLKGLNTKEKLYCLMWWQLTAYGTLFTDRNRDIIRVNNYLGALKRSGHLDHNLRVAKL